MCELSAAMAQKEAAAALANILSKVARYSVALGIGASALQASLYTGAACASCGPDPNSRRQQPL